MFWPDANIEAELLRDNRALRGIFRAVADLVEAMAKDLRLDLYAYGDRKLRKELKNCREITSTLGKRLNQVMHIRLSSIPRRREGVSIKDDAL